MEVLYSPPGFTGVPVKDYQAFLMKSSLFFFNSLAAHIVCGILVNQRGIKLMHPALEAQSFNHWTARAVPEYLFLFQQNHNDF